MGELLPVSTWSNVKNDVLSFIPMNEGAGEAPAPIASQTFIIWIQSKDFA